MTDTPHFDLPFRLKGNKFSDVEQDSLDDLINCITAAIRTEIGFRKEIPTFGTIDTTFQVQPIRSQEFIEQIILHEPRANIVLDQSPDKLNELIASVMMRVSAREEDANVD